MQNLHGSLSVHRAQCYASHEQRPARFSLISSERAKGSLIVSSTQVYSKYSSSDYKSDRHWSTSQCHSADEQCHNSERKWGWIFLSKLILNIKVAPSEHTSRIKCIMPKFFNIHATKMHTPKTPLCLKWYLYRCWSSTKNMAFCILNGSQPNTRTQDG